MLNKFFPHGTGLGKEPIDYLLGKDRKRAGATVLRGDPDLTEQLINTAPGRYRYTSGALSFAEPIDDETAEKIIDEYERFFSADGAAEINILWVKHTDKGRTELHFLIPNVELATGKAFYPYVHRIDRTTIDTLKDIINAQYNLIDPKDPIRKRLDASAEDYLKQSKPRKQLAEKIGAHIEQLVRAHIAAGGTWTRANTIAALKALGYTIERQTKTTISIGHPNLKKNLRLKGTYYEAHCRIDQDHFEQLLEASQNYHQARTARLQEAKEKYEQLLAKRRERIARRYRKDQTAQKDQTPKSAPPPQTPQPEPPTDPTPTPTFKPTKKQKKRTRAAWRPAPQDGPKRTPYRPPEGLHDPCVIPIYYRGRLIGTLLDYGDLIEAHHMSDKAAAINIIKLAIEKGWQQIYFEGNDKFLYYAMRMALDRGLEVITNSDHQAKILQQVKEEKAQDDRARETATRTLDRAKRANRNLDAANRTLDETLERSRQTGERLERTGEQLRRSAQRLCDLARALDRIKTPHHRDEDIDYDGPSF